MFRTDPDTKICTDKNKNESSQQNYKQENDRQQYKIKSVHITAIKGK
jgi:hypothetical protein